MRLLHLVSNLIFTHSDCYQLEKSEYKEPFKKYEELAASSFIFDLPVWLPPCKIPKHEDIEQQPDNVNFEWDGPRFRLLVGKLILLRPFGVFGLKSYRLVLAEVLFGVEEILHCVR